MVNAFGIGIGPDSGNPGEVLSDHLKNGDQPFLRQRKGISVTEKQPCPVSAVLLGEKNVSLEGGMILYPEFLSLVHATEAAFVVGAAGGDLEKNTVCFTWWPENVSFIVHKRILKVSLMQ